MEDFLKKTQIAYNQNHNAIHINNLKRKDDKGLDCGLKNILGVKVQAVNLLEGNQYPDRYFRGDIKHTKGEHNIKSNENPLHKYLKELFNSLKKIEVEGKSFTITNPRNETPIKVLENENVIKRYVIDFTCDEFMLEVCYHSEIDYHKKLFLESYGKGVNGVKPVFRLSVMDFLENKPHISLEEITYSHIEKYLHILKPIKEEEADKYNKQLQDLDDINKSEIEQLRLQVMEYESRPNIQNDKVIQELKEKLRKQSQINKFYFASEIAKQAKIDTQDMLSFLVKKGLFIIADNGLKIPSSRYFTGQNIMSFTYIKSKPALRLSYEVKEKVLEFLKKNYR